MVVVLEVTSSVFNDGHEISVLIDEMSSLWVSVLHLHLSRARVFFTVGQVLDDGELVPLEHGRALPAFSHRQSLPQEPSPGRLLCRPFVEGFLSRILCVFGVVINTPVMTDGGLSVSPDDR